jgi:hypothetical protein
LFFIFFLKKMSNRVLLIALYLLVNQCVASAQITDDFSDGDFTTNPTWVGDVANFQVNATQTLQLMAPAAGTSTLMTQGNIADSSVWNLTFRLEFGPSTSNLLRIFLLADAASPSTSSGYFLEIGENGTADALRLFRQDAGVPTLLATGVAGLVGTDPTDIRLRVQRSAAGTWTCEAAPTATGVFAPQFSVSDATYAGGPTRWFGFQCVYTATRTDKFFFDDLSVLPDLPDTTPPALVSAVADDATQVTAQFSEALDSTSASTAANFSIVGGPAVSTATWSSGAPNQVVLTLADGLTSGNWTLSTANLRDAVGNASASQSVDFQFVLIDVASEFDLLINEIMADPSPSVGLPDAVEWIEILNRSDKIIQLSSLRLEDSGGSPVPLPAYLLLPDSVVVLCPAADAALLANSAPNVLGMGSFPSLNNTSDVLALSRPTGQLIDRVAYDLFWHTESDKREGGWSLERINPNTPCLGRTNWQSCPALPGGSPGRRNLSWSDAPDVTAPSAAFIFLENSTTLRVQFSEGMDPVAGTDLAGYTLVPPVAISSASIDPLDRRIVTLTLAAPLSPSVLYTLILGDALTDCVGNPLSPDDTLTVGIPEVPDFQDIIFNELLPNPATGGSRFVELHNPTNKIFSLKNILIANYADGTDVQAIDQDRLLLPGGYVALTIAPNDILARFEATRSADLVTVNLPSMDDKTGKLRLFWSENGQTRLLDSLDYTDEWHNALFSVSDREGVSLERIRADQPTNLAQNWTSAARLGTPTRRNSQAQATLTPDDLVTLSPARISPDGDGYEDFLDIQFNLPSAGYSATLTIFDAEGLPIRHLVRQELLGTEGSLRWDGDTDDGTRARPGIHLVFLEIFAPDGSVRRVKKPFAVVARW